MKQVGTFLDEVASIPGGEKILECIQCGTCTGSCPNANRMDYPPREVIALVRAGMKEEVLRSNSMWFCASCYLCTVRCPRDIKPTELMHILEGLAVRHDFKPKTSTPEMYRKFVRSIESNGRVHEFGFMMSYLLNKPFTALGMLNVARNLRSHGRLRVKATKIKGTGEVKAIRDKARSLGGNQ